MQQNDRHGRISTNEVLQVSRRCRGQGDVVIPKTGVELERFLPPRLAVPDQLRRAMHDQVVQLNVLQPLEVL